MKKEKRAITVTLRGEARGPSELSYQLPLGSRNAGWNQERSPMSL
jgi:hypothetical protein